MKVMMREIGLARPHHRLEQPRAAEIAGVLSGVGERASRRMNAVFRRSGVERRGGVGMIEVDGQLEHRWLVPDESGAIGCPTTGERLSEFMQFAPDIACEASRKALERSSTSPSSVTHIVTASCTGFASPGIDHMIIDRLGLPRETRRTNVGFMGCHAALNAIRVARAFAMSDPDAVVLVCCIELCSVHFQAGESRDAMMANALFADGSAATVISSGDLDDADGLELIACASQYLPDSTDAMTWTVTDHGFQMTLDSSVPDRLESAVGGWVRSWLAEHDLTVPEIGAWAIHPGGPQIISAVRDALEIDEALCAPSRAILAEHGNMSSPTILYVLDRLFRSDEPRPWVALAFGPGLSAEGLLIR